MKRAKQLALSVGLALFLASCGPRVDKVVPDRVSAEDIIDLRDPVGGSLGAQGTVHFGVVEAPIVLNWAPEDVFVEVPAGLTAEEAVVYVEIVGLKSNITRLSILPSEPSFGIMCFGDSIIYGGVPEAMQRLLDEDPYVSGLEPVVMNQGKPMEFITREGTWPRWLNALDYHDHGLVILLEATNDVRDTAMIPMASIQESLIRMVDEVTGRGIDLILCTLLPRVGACGDVQSPTAAEYNAWLVSYAGGRGIPVVDLYEAFLSTPDWEHVLFGPEDCLHPNMTGKERIAELLTDQIEQMVSAF